MPSLEVHVVTPDAEVWSGEATFVIARAAGGDVGILPNHEPVMSTLRPGELKVESPNGDFVAEVDGGFLSVGTVGTSPEEMVTRVDVLAEHVKQ